jgi:hypothetical protein
MANLPEMRDLTQRLLTYEANARNPSQPEPSPTLQVYEKLRHSLVALAGIAGFQSLAARALSLARSDAPNLSAVRVTEEGNLQGMTGTQLRINLDEDRLHKGGVIFISRLLGLLLIFLGETLMMNLIRDVWPDAALDDCNSENGRKT